MSDMTQTLTQLILIQLQDTDNRKIVNEGQPHFTVEYEHESNLIFIGHGLANFPFDTLNESLQFFVIRHCINLLPCFDKKAPISIGDKITLELNQYNSDNLCHTYLVCKLLKSNCWNQVPIIHGKDWDGAKEVVGEVTDIALVQDVAISNTMYQVRLEDITNQKTIRQALLTCGAMNLEELEDYAKTNQLLINIQ